VGRDEGYPYVRALPDGRLVGVALLLGGQADVCAARGTAQPTCGPIADAARAVQAAHAWDGTGAPPAGTGTSPAGAAAAAPLTPPLCA